MVSGGFMKKEWGGLSRIPHIHQDPWLTEPLTGRWVSVSFSFALSCTLTGPISKLPTKVWVDALEDHRLGNWGDVPGPFHTGFDLGSLWLLWIDKVGSCSVNQRQAIFWVSVFPPVVQRNLHSLVCFWSVCFVSNTQDWHYGTEVKYSHALDSDSWPFSEFSLEQQSVHVCLSVYSFP